jgi:hypothetical protein
MSAEEKEHVRRARETGMLQIASSTPGANSILIKDRVGARRRGNYLCSVCGYRKKGHICISNYTYFDDDGKGKTSDDDDLDVDMVSRESPFQKIRRVSALSSYTMALFV